MPSIDGWQLHRSLNRGAENVPDERIANLDETTSAWIKISASADGSFTVTNGRTGVSKAYRRYLFVDSSRPTVEADGRAGPGGVLGLPPPGFATL